MKWGGIAEKIGELAIFCYIPKDKEEQIARENWLI